MMGVGMALVEYGIVSPIIFLLFVFIPLLAADHSFGCSRGWGLLFQLFIYSVEDTCRPLVGRYLEKEAISGCGAGFHMLTALFYYR